MPGPYYAANIDELFAGIAAATPGEVIYLTARTYGDLSTYMVGNANRPTGYATIKPLPGYPAPIFSRIGLNSTNGLAFENIEVRASGAGNAITIGGCDRIKVTNFRIRNTDNLSSYAVATSGDSPGSTFSNPGPIVGNGVGISVLGSTNVDILNGDIQHVGTGIGITNASNGVTVSWVDIHDIIGDFLDGYSSSNITLKRVRGWDSYPAGSLHPDFVQIDDTSGFIADEVDWYNGNSDPINSIGDSLPGVIFGGGHDNAFTTPLNTSITVPLANLCPSGYTIVSLGTKFLPGSGGDFVLNSSPQSITYTPPTGFSSINDKTTWPYVIYTIQGPGGRQYQMRLIGSVGQNWISSTLPNFQTTITATSSQAGWVTDWTIRNCVIYGGAHVNGIGIEDVQRVTVSGIWMKGVDPYAPQLILRNGVMEGTFSNLSTLTVNNIGTNSIVLDGVTTSSAYPTPTTLLTQDTAYTVSNFTAAVAARDAAIGFPALPTVTLGANVTVDEGTGTNSTITFTVTRSGDTSRPCSCLWSITGQGANPVTGADFAEGALPSSFVSFLAGETSKTIVIPLASDATIEPDESMTITLSSPYYCTLATATAIGTIRNDDYPIPITLKAGAPTSMRLRLPTPAPPAPVLRTTSTETFGRLSGAGPGFAQTDLWGKLGISRQSGILQWEVRNAQASGGGVPTDFEYTIPLTQDDYARYWAGGVGGNFGRTPYVKTTRHGLIVGSYSWEFRCRVDVTGNGVWSEWSNWSTLTYNIDPQGCTWGDKFLANDNYAGNVFYAYSDGLTPYNLATNPLRTIYIPPGVQRTYYAMGPNYFNFPGPTKVKLKYADPTRPVRINGLGLNTAKFMSIDGLRGGVYEGNTQGHVQLSNCTDMEVINCDFRRTEQEYVAGDATLQFAGVIVTGSSTNNILINNNLFEHNFRCISIAEGSNITATNNKGRYCHGQPFFIGANALQVTTFTIQDNTFWAPFRTQSPSVDTGNHLDWLQLGDANGTVVAKNPNIKRNVFIMANANSGVRGYAGGGNASANPGTLDITDNIITNWGPDGFEIFGFGAGSAVKRNVAWLMRSGTDTTAPDGSKKDQYAPVFRGFNVGYLTTSANLGAGASLLLEDNFTYGTTSLPADATVLAAVTTTNQVSYARNDTTVAAAFVRGNPETYLLSFNDWADMDPTQWATVRQRALNAFERIDGKGPVAVGAAGFNS